MKTFYSILFLALFTLIFSSCKKETEGTLAIDFVTRFNQQPLALNSKYPFQNGEIEFTMVNFYVSNISVEDKDGIGKIPLKDVDLVKMGSNSTLNFTLKEGAYKNLFLGLGLDEILDSTDPSMYGNDHPLGINQNNFWLMSNSYIYVKIEGFFYVNGDKLNISYHLGDTSFYKTLTSTNAFSIYANNTTNKKVILNLEQFFNNVIIEDNLSTHTVENVPFALLMMNNFEAALTIQ